MNRIIVGSLVVLLSTACTEKKNGAFEVSGVIKNASGHKVLLMELPYISNSALALDSATIDKKGAFSLSTVAKEEGIYKLVLDNGPEVVLINDNNSISVKMDVIDYRHYTTEGSPASENLHKLFEDYTAKDSILLTTFKELDTIAKQPGSDSIVTVLRARRDKQLETLNSAVKDFITSSPSPASVFYAIGLASRTMPVEDVKPLVDKSVAKFKGHSGLLAAQKMLATQTPAKTPQYSLLNQQAPEIALPDVNGKTVSLNSLKGKFVLVDFWASWCGPCRAENPNVVQAYNKFKNKNFTILGVSLDQDREAWKQAIAKDNLTWTHISDLKQWESTVVAAYGIEGIPFNVLLDPTGKIIASSLRGEELEEKLGEVLR